MLDRLVTTTHAKSFDGTKHILLATPGSPPLLKKNGTPEVVWLLNQPKVVAYTRWTGEDRPMQFIHVLFAKNRPLVLSSMAHIEERKTGQIVSARIQLA